MDAPKPGEGPAEPAQETLGIVIPAQFSHSGYHAQATPLDSTYLNTAVAARRLYFFLLLMLIAASSLLLPSLVLPPTIHRPIGGLVRTRLFWIRAAVGYP